MASDLLDGLVRANLAGAGAGLLMLTLRGRLRPLIGPSAVYALWLAVPAAAFASLLPARTVSVVVQAAAATVPGAARSVAEPSTPGWNAPAILIAVWLAGAAAAVLWACCQQYRFLSQAGQTRTRRRVVKTASDKAGPAVVGVISPRILLPSDFSSRFNSMQRRVVLAHEAVHLARGDSRINAAVLLLQCLSWFNPVAHLAARAMRLDQELSCDALVMARFPRARRSYAEAMLKSQVGAIALPTGCYWPARGPSALARRLSMLRAAPVSRSRMLTGLASAGLAAAAAGMIAWSIQPPRQRIVLESASQPVAIVLPSAMDRAAAISPRVIRSHPKLAARVTPASDTPSPVIIAAARPMPPRFVEWISMPMPPETESGDPVDVAAFHGGATAPDGRMMDQSSVGGGQTSSTYRNGDYQMRSDFTQVGATVRISAQLLKGGAVIGTGTATVVAGETAYVALSNGQMATLAPGQTAYIMTRPAPGGRTSAPPS